MQMPQRLLYAFQKFPQYLATTIENFNLLKSKNNNVFL